MKGILLDDANDLIVEHGTWKVGPRKMQDAYMVLSMNKGDLKEDPLAGANLLQMIRAKENREAIRKAIEVALLRVNIRFQDVKHEMDVWVNRQLI